jgi:hypothetical protein
MEHETIIIYEVAPTRNRAHDQLAEDLQKYMDTSQDRYITLEVGVIHLYEYKGNTPREIGTIYFAYKDLYLRQCVRDVVYFMQGNKLKSRKTAYK